MLKREREERYEKHRADAEFRTMKLKEKRDLDKIKAIKKRSKARIESEKAENSKEKDNLFEIFKMVRITPPPYFYSYYFF